MSLPEPLREFYKFTYNSNGTGGQFEFSVFFRMSHETGYAGDGTEIGGGYAPGLDNLTAVAEGIARGIEVNNAPYWDNITIVSIDAVPAAMTRLVP